jgi:metal-responsive CopG/Arc/MetJ family transcriptional regulator
MDDVVTLSKLMEEQNPMQTTSPKRKITVSLPAEIVQYVEDLAHETDRDRSWILGAIVRVYRERLVDGEPVKSLDKSLSVIRA